MARPEAVASSPARTAQIGRGFATPVHPSGFQQSRGPRAITKHAGPESDGPDKYLHTRTARAIALISHEVWLPDFIIAFTGKRAISC